MNDIFPRLIRFAWKTALLMGIVFCIAFIGGYVGGRNGIDRELSLSMIWIAIKIVGTPVALWVLSDFDKAPKGWEELLFECVLIWLASGFLSGMLGYDALVGRVVGGLMCLLITSRMTTESGKEAEKG